MPQAQRGFTQAGQQALRLELDGSVMLIIYDKGVQVTNNDSGFTRLDDITVDERLVTAADAVLNAPHAEESDYHLVEASCKLICDLPGPCPH